MGKSKKLSLKGQEKAQEALDNLCGNHQFHADKLEVSRCTLSKFLNGKPVGDSYFTKFCNYLRLDIVDVIFREPNQIVEPICLTRWFKFRFENNWQLIRHSQYNFRETKIIPVNRFISFDDDHLKLISLLKKTDTENIEVKFQIHPRERQYLPLGLRLLAESSEGENLTDKVAQEKNEFMQLDPLELNKSEQFLLTVALKEFSYTQKFAF